jgi:hypothetical protein
MANSESGMGLPHSKTLTRPEVASLIPQGLGVRQPSAAFVSSILAHFSDYSSNQHGISSPIFAAACETSLSPRPDKFTMISWSFGSFGAR